MPKTAAFDVRKPAILARAIQRDKGDLAPAAARAFLRFKLAQPDRERLHQLLVKNQDDLLTADERAQLDDYLTIGMVLTRIPHRFLTKEPPSVNKMQL